MCKRSNKFVITIGLIEVILSLRISSWTKAFELWKDWCRIIFSLVWRCKLYLIYMQRRPRLLFFSRPWMDEAQDGRRRKNYDVPWLLRSCKKMQKCFRICKNNTFSEPDTRFHSYWDKEDIVLGRRITTFKECKIDFHHLWESRLCQIFSPTLRVVTQNLSKISFNHICTSYHISQCREKASIWTMANCMQ